MLRNGKWLLVLLVLVGAVALFAACAAPTEKVAKPGEGSPLALATKTPLPADVKPISGGWLRIYHAADPYFWDPLAGTAAAHLEWNEVSHPLVQINYGPGYDPRNFDISKGGLAESWEISSDGLTYTFHIRKGVKWDDRPPLNGREVVATDVKWTYERHMATPGAPRREWLSNAIKSIECPDKYTVVIQIKQPMADFLLLLAGWYCEILPREVAELYGDFKKPEACMGFGAFRLKEFVPNVREVFEKNPNYYGAPVPYVDGRYSILIPDASTSLAAFRAEKIDMRAVSRMDLPSVKQTNPNAYCYEEELAMSAYAMAFRTDKAPFNDANLRRAVSMAIDRKTIVDTFYYGYGTEQNGPLYVESPWYLKDQGECAKYYKYNPEEARRLVAEAGYPGGLSISFAVNAGGGEAYLGYCDYLVDALGKVGIKATFKMYESAAYTSAVRSKREYDDMTLILIFSVTSWGPDIFLNQIHGTGYASNISLVSDPKLDEMMKAQSVEMDPVKRQVMLNDIQRYCACQSYYVYWPIGLGVTCLQPWVRQYCSHVAIPLTGAMLRHVWLTEDAPGRKM